MPWTDWQFWLVTLMALWGVWVLARPFIRRPRGDASKPSCPNCASGSAAAKPRRVALTVGSKRV